MIPWTLALVAELAYAVIWLLLALLFMGWETAGAALPPALAGLTAALAAALVWEGGAGGRLLRRERLRTLARGVLALAALAAGALAVAWTVGPLRDAWLLGAVAAWYGCYQGVQAGQEGIEHHRLARRFGFQAPLLVLALLGVLAAGGGAVPAVAVLSALSVAGYFAAALAGLALARQRDTLRRQQAAGEEGTAALSPGTALLLALVILSLGLLAAWATGAALASRTAAAAGRVALDLLTLIFRLVWLVLFRVALLVAILIEAVISRLRSASRQPLLNWNAPGELEQLRDQATVPGHTGAYILIALGVLALVLAVLLLSHRRPRRRREEDGELRESVFTWGLLAEQLRDLFAGLLGRLRRHLRPASPAGPADAAAPGPAADLRAIYRALQRMGAAFGRPRCPSQTPGQYRRTLADLLPGGDSHLAVITAAYERLRYGPEPPAEPEVVVARAALVELRAVAPRGEGTTAAGNAMAAGSDISQPTRSS